MANDQSQRDLVLAPGEYAFIQDRTQGALKICTGPSSSTPSQSDVPVRFDPKTLSFLPVGLDQVVQKNAHADDGNYIVLRNPAKDNVQPKVGLKGTAFEYSLQIGSKVVIPGPADFALWPQQSAEVIEGHHLKSNQYLLVRVYNEELAKKNWTSAIMRPATPTGGAEGTGGASTDPNAQGTQTQSAPAPQQAQVPLQDLTTGKLHVIKGTDVSFYIPPTGVEVVKTDDGKYVRDALTLEQMEYCILIDENGRKRNERGPQVVFPKPTERFHKTRQGETKFQAIELNAIQGIHVKALVDYEDKEMGVQFKAGEEYFITGEGTYDSQSIQNDVEMKGHRVGDGTTIYFPREEIAFIKYDGKTKHFATTVPDGEGRYVLDRETGEVVLVQGPKQLLPNPARYVIARRVLSDKQCTLWFPGNQEALLINQGYAAAMANAPTTRAGTLSEGDLERAYRGVTKGMDVRTRGLIANAAPVAAAMFAGETSRVSGEQQGHGDEFERQSGYTQPRTLTLNTKYQGAISLRVWTGYAIMVLDKKGHRKVVQGPANVLLNYDEELEVLSFSTGKPKTTDALKQDVYLRTENNKVSDIVRVETADHVFVDLKLSYKVNFAGEPTRWFSVDNPVKFLCDHARSMLKGAVRKIRVEQFYADATDIARDVLLGKKADGANRPGLHFDENGMQVDDFEVLGIEIVDPNIQKLLTESQLLVVRTNVELANAQRNLEVEKQKQQIAREQTEARAETEKRNHELSIELTNSQVASNLAKLAAAMKETEEKISLAEKENELEKQNAESEIAIESARQQAKVAALQAEQNVRLEELKSEVEAAVKRFEAAKGGMTDALVALSNQDLVAKVGQALNIQQIIGGESLVESINRIFAGSPVAELLKKAMQPVLPAGNGRQVQPQ